MGYRINYPPGNSRKGTGSSLIRVTALTGMFILLFLLVVGVYWPEGKAALKTMVCFIRDILPTDELDVLADKLAQGENIKAVFMEFGCQVLEKSGHAGN